jgi:hypothetical protein
MEEGISPFLLARALKFQLRVITREINWPPLTQSIYIYRLGQLRRLTIFLGASHQLENMKCARIMKNEVD